MPTLFELVAWVTAILYFIGAVFWIGTMIHRVFLWKKRERAEQQLFSKLDKLVLQQSKIIASFDKSKPKTP